ncbi:MAG: hypothetical protein KA152_00495 [Verrucomicrobiales bacterium]|nr:hypothetical protein [Verrucomicrobiales bacterium]
MAPTLSPSAETFLFDWSITFAIGGAFCLIIGFFIGWIIWKNTRRLSEQVEGKNRTAFADYEKTSEEIAKIKSELTVTGE